MITTERKRHSYRKKVFLVFTRDFPTTLKSFTVKAGTSVYVKAMKSSYLFGPFWDLKFWRFPLLKIKSGWVL